MSDRIHVAVAVIVNESNEVCISLRHQHAHQGGLWEFPGGKVESNETVEQTLLREIREETGLTITGFRPLIRVNHVYQHTDRDRAVCLHVFRVLSYKGQASGLEGQQLEWIAVPRLENYDFPAANHAIIKAVQLPDRYLITGNFTDSHDFLNKLQNALNNDFRLIQLRLKNQALHDLATLQSMVEQAALLSNKANARLMLNMSTDGLEQLDLSNLEFAGLHADSRTLQTLSHRPPAELFSASCHNRDELRKAEELKADFAVLSPVQKTASHPEMDALGWRRFSEMTENISMPVYALGGVSGDDLDTAWSYGAQGVAAISAFWK